MRLRCFFGIRRQRSQAVRAIPHQPRRRASRYGGRGTLRILVVVIVVTVAVPVPIVIVPAVGPLPIVVVASALLPAMVVIVVIASRRWGRRGRWSRCRDDVDRRRRRWRRRRELALALLFAGRLRFRRRRRRHRLRSRERRANEDRRRIDRGARRTQRELGAERRVPGTPLGEGAGTLLGAGTCALPGEGSLDRRGDANDELITRRRAELRVNRRNRLLVGEHASRHGEEARQSGAQQHPCDHMHESRPHAPPGCSRQLFKQTYRSQPEVS
jgi:hypothetical protein